MRKTSLFASLMCLLISTCALGIGGNMGGADPNGSPEKPYLIEDLADFDTFADPNNAATYWAAGVHTKLMTDIDLSGRTYTTAVIAPDENNTTADHQGPKFTGHFDGDSYTLFNLTIDQPTKDYIGLFGCIAISGQVKNMGLKNVDITGFNYVGGLCGRNYGTINSSYAAGNVTGTRNYIGGLCGQNDDAISNSGAMSDVTGGGLVGGLCGRNGYNGTISNSYATGDVTGGMQVGGLCGLNYSNATISASYATGSATGGYRVGGLCGDNWDTISESYATGSVVGSDYIGGLCGSGGGPITTSYFIEGSGPDNGYGTPLDDPNMMIQANFVGWDFTTPVWMMLREGEDYPRLAWQEVFAGDIAGLYGADMVDFAYLANYWGQDCDSPACDRADVDGGGNVGIGDLAYIAEDWLK